MRHESISSGDPLAAGGDAGGDLDLGALARAVRARGRGILIPTLAALLLSAVVVQLVPPLYKSTSSVLLQQQESVFTRPTGEQVTQAQAPMDEQTVQSQVQMIMSRDLAVQAIRKLDLVGNPEFDPAAGGIGPLTRVLMVLGFVANPLDQPAEERVLDAYYEALSAYPKDKSSVIEIAFGSRSPDLSAKAANVIADLYIARQQAAKRGESATASDALSPQIDELRQKVAKAEAAVEDFRAKNGLFSSEQRGTISTQQLTDITTQLSAARAQQADSQAKAQLLRELLKSGKPTDISDVTNNDLIRRLVEQRVGMQAQLALESRTLLPGHPRIKELTAQLADLQGQIRAEVTKTVRSLETDAQVAGARVASLTQQVNAQKQESAVSNDQEVKLRAMEREAKSQRDLLESYLARFREASARASFNALPADAWIISQAVASPVPYFPRKLPIILLTTLGVLVLSLALVAAGELLSGRAFAAPRQRRPVSAWPRPDAAAAEPEPPVDPTPTRRRLDPAPREEALSAHNDHRMDAPTPAMAEAALLAEMETPLPPPEAPTAELPAAQKPAPVPEPTPEPIQRDSELDALAARVLGAGGGRHSVLFTGSGRREGIASAAAHFARRLSEGGPRVILVDLNLGRGAPGKPGLGDLLAGDVSFIDVIERDAFSRLHLIAAGSDILGVEPHLASERLSTAFEALVATYDMVVFDGGSLDPASGREPVWSPIASVCESALVVAVPDPEVTARTQQMLAALGARAVGAVEGEPAAGGLVAA